MFEHITTEQQKGLARRGSSMAVSILLHGAAIGLALAIATYVHARAAATPEPVAVTFHVAPPPPPPPPPLGGRKPKTSPRQTPKQVVKVPTHMVIQPKELPKVEAKPPETVPDSPEDEDDDESVEGGVEGGVAGGVAGGVVGGRLGGQLGAEGPPQLLGAGMSRPTPSGDCAPSGTRPKPPMPEQAKQMAISGVVLLEYTVHADGHVDSIVLKNPTAPPMLYGAVKEWLGSCPFKPSMSGNRPIPVKIVQAFNFKLTR